MKSAPRAYALLAIWTLLLPLCAIAAWSQDIHVRVDPDGPGAASAQRVPWSHQLTANEAAAFAPAIFLRRSDNWNAIAEAARLP
jgi:hypothetical protein